MFDNRVGRAPTGGGCLKSALDKWDIECEEFEMPDEFRPTLYTVDACTRWNNRDSPFAVRSAKSRGLVVKHCPLIIGVATPRGMVPTEESATANLGDGGAVESLVCAYGS